MLYSVFHAALYYMRWIGDRSVYHWKAAPPLLFLFLLCCIPSSSFGETISYQYDDFGQLKSAAYSDGILQEYSYDAIGNRLAFTILLNQTMTVTTLTSAPNPSTYGDTVTLTATVTGSDTAPTGTMSFSDSGLNLCAGITMSGGQATCETAALSSGIRSITAEYSGDQTHFSSSGTTSHTVNQAAQIITFAPMGDRALGDADFTLSATASSGLTVSFASTTPSVCTVSGTTASLVGSGTCSITASQAGDTNHLPAPNISQSFNVLVLVHVTPSAGTGGSISPATVQNVASGDSVSFIITPDTGHSVAIPVGGTCGGSISGHPSDTVNGITYTIDGVTANCTVEASFSPNQHTVTASVGANGSLDGATPSPQTVDYGDTMQFIFHADPNYHLASVTGCNINYYNDDNAVGSYTAITGAVTEDCTVSATFAMNRYLLTVTVKGKGSVTSDSGGLSCLETCSGGYWPNTTVTLTPTPDENEEFLGWSGDDNCEDGVVTMTADISCTAEFTGFPWLLYLPVLLNMGNQNQ